MGKKKNKYAEYSKAPDPATHDFILPRGHNCAKQPYKNGYHAHKSASVLSHEYNKLMVAYRCDGCNAWHVGTARQQPEHLQWIDL